MGKANQVILAGIGGQGLILGGHILAHAAMIEGKNVVQSKSYGTQSRGGHSQTEVIIADDPIYYPYCDSPDIVLTLSQQAYDKYWDQVPEDCLIIYDKDLVNVQHRDKQVGYSLRNQALDLGKEQVMNILSLGFIIKHMPFLKQETIEESIRHELPEKLHSLNVHTFRVGLGVEE